MVGKPSVALAEFDTAGEIYHACEHVRDAGFSRWDAHTPFPVHGLDKAMGIGRSRVPWIALVCGFTGAGLAFWLQAWVHSSAYPLVINAKPYMSWQAYIPVTFEVGVLFTALGTLIGMLALNRLPQHYNSLFKSARFERSTDDKFFISIAADDPRFQGEETLRFLQGLGASHVELIED
ncbi:DUF3341 domain-containing protein [Myxococcota bacterium]|nr:DUF3341 domain-containing protein [Myxococcota bacterium]